MLVLLLHDPSHLVLHLKMKVQNCTTAAAATKAKFKWLLARITPIYYNDPFQGVEADDYKGLLIVNLGKREGLYLIHVLTLLL